MISNFLIRAVSDDLTSPNTNLFKYFLLKALNIAGVDFLSVNSRTWCLALSLCRKLSRLDSYTTETKFYIFF